MKYISTRGQAPSTDFAGACLAGLAPDGGLYVPETFPQIAPPAKGETYAEVAARILSAFTGDAIPLEDLKPLCERAYGSFSHQCVDQRACLSLFAQTVSEPQLVVGPRALKASPLL